VYNHVLNSNPDCKIILIGQSLGTGPTLYLASKIDSFPLTKVVLISPFKSILSIYMSKMVTSLFYKFDMFMNENKIQLIKNVDIYIIHGTMDELIPIEHVKELAAKSDKCIFKIIQGGTHSNLFSLESMLVYLMTITR